MKRIASFGALAAAALALGLQGFGATSAQVLDNGGLSVTFSQTGLTPGVQSYTVRGTVQAVYACVN
ncbi:MAG TPA: hypothetical protein VEX38_06010, partial [Fimbriimonadaceae bacterium]|nr:hypothetical protein [Fimbriimonadaceae bacterium]